MEYKAPESDITMLAEVASASGEPGGTGSWETPVDPFW